MRLVIVLLVGMCVWLLAERNRLSTGVASVEGNVQRLEREKTALQLQYAQALANSNVVRTVEAPPPPATKNWLQQRIEQSSNALDGTSRAGSRR